jgi:molecular chaperone IbpA
MSKLPSLFDRQFFVGFDDLIDRVNQSVHTDKFPPHDIVKTGDSTYAIIMAIAGFTKKDIVIDLDKNVLSIKGAKIKSLDDEEVEYPRYIYQGISNRAFTKQFTLQEHIVVKGAKVEDGMLTISLEEIVPEDRQSRSIAIE